MLFITKLFHRKTFALQENFNTKSFLSLFFFFQMFITKKCHHNLFFFTSITIVTIFTTVLLSLSTVAHRAPAPSKARTGWNWFSSFWYGTARSNKAELSCLFSVLLLAVPEAVLSHSKIRRRSAVQSIPSLAPRCPRGSLVPYQSEEHQFCGALLMERTMCGMLSRS